VSAVAACWTPEPAAARWSTCFESSAFDAVGLEPDERYARHAREVLGVPVETGFVQDHSFPPGRFDAITMYHALEHVEDPVGILAKLRAGCRTGRCC